MELREMIMNECLNYKTNFNGIDDLVQKESDYQTAENNGYDFVSCPQTYECLDGVEQLCGSDNIYSGNSTEECNQCWRIALKESKITT